MADKSILKELGNKKKIGKLLVLLIKKASITKEDREPSNATRRVIMSLPKYFHTTCINCYRTDKDLLKRGYCLGCEFYAGSTKVKVSTKSHHYKLKILSCVTSLYNEYAIAYSSYTNPFYAEYWWKSKYWELLRKEQLDRYPACQSCGSMDGLTVSNKVSIANPKLWKYKIKGDFLRTICRRCKDGGQLSIL